MTRFARYKKSFNAERISDAAGAGMAEKPETTKEKKQKKTTNRHDVDDATAKMHFLQRKQKRGEELSSAERDELAALVRQDVDKARLSKMRKEKRRCLRCRQRGHAVTECPVVADTAVDAATETATTDTTPKTAPTSTKKWTKAVCYNCGSEEHTLRDCPTPRGDALRYASCYICTGHGHIARDCPQNTRGIYPNGGGCRFCGSNRHLARDCVRGGGIDTEGTGRGEQIVGTAGRGDEDHLHAALRSIDAEREANKRVRSSKHSTTTKIVAF